MLKFAHADIYFYYDNIRSRFRFILFSTEFRSISILTHCICILPNEILKLFPATRKHFFFFSQRNKKMKLFVSFSSSGGQVSFLDFEYLQFKFFWPNDGHMKNNQENPIPFWLRRAFSLSSCALNCAKISPYFANKRACMQCLDKALFMLVLSRTCTCKLLLKYRHAKRRKLITIFILLCLV